MNHEAVQGRLRRISRKVHNTVLKPLGRPSVYRPVFLALVILNAIALLRFFFGPKPPPKPPKPRPPMTLAQMPADCRTVLNAADAKQ